MTTTQPKSSEVRQWARSQGMEVGERGRLSPELIEAYIAANGGKPSARTAAKKAPAKKAPAKKAATKRAPAKKAAASRASSSRTASAAPASKPLRTSNPPMTSNPPSTSNPPVESPAPVRATEAPTPPIVAVDGARVEALEAQLEKLAARVERLEAARAQAAQKRGLFNRK